MYHSLYFLFNALKKFGKFSFTLSETEEIVNPCCFIHSGKRCLITARNRRKKAISAIGVA